ncbi:hypothetical protein J2X71_000008 [Rhizobium sp. 1399]|nr:hypothetical protein [Rhizobium sp. 1399]
MTITPLEAKSISLKMNKYFLVLVHFAAIFRLSH